GEAAVAAAVRGARLLEKARRGCQPRLTPVPRTVRQHKDERARPLQPAVYAQLVTGMRHDERGRTSQQLLCRHTASVGTLRFRTALALPSADAVVWERLASLIASSCTKYA